MHPKKPVLIIQHTRVGHPGAVLPLLEQLGVTWVLVSLPRGDKIPDDITPYGGLILMGGGMSANDDLDWIHTETCLIQQAYALGVPIAGHCLGSQIMSKALGAQVRKNAHKEIGWQPVNPTDSSQVQRWFGDLPQAIHFFQWHGDTFELPAGADRLLSSEACLNQAYVLDDKHIAMQFHLEMTPQLVEVSLEANGNELQREVAANSPFVNTLEQARLGVHHHMPRMHEALHALYSRWVENRL